MLAICAMKVRQTREWDRPDLPEVLKAAANKSQKSIAQVCREAGISTAFWYQLVKGNKDSITLDTLTGLCKALGVTLEDVGLLVDPSQDDSGEPPTPGH